MVHKNTDTFAEENKTGRQIYKAALGTVISEESPFLTVVKARLVKVTFRNRPRIGYKQVNNV